LLYAQMCHARVECCTVDAIAISDQIRRHDVPADRFDVLGDCVLVHRMTNFRKFVGDSPATPHRILRGHSRNERGAFGADRRATDRSRPRRPISRKAGTMPGDDRRRLDHRKGIRPTSPQSGDDNPEGPVDWTQAGARCLATENRELLAKYKVFQDQIGRGRSAANAAPKIAISIASTPSRSLSSIEESLSNRILHSARLVGSACPRSLLNTVLFTMTALPGEGRAVDPFFLTRPTILSLPCSA